MRVLITTDTIGGVWTFTKELTEGLLQSGHAVALVSLGRAPSREHLLWCSHQSKKHGDAFIYESSNAPLEWMQANDRAYSGAAPHILRMIEDFAPDLLHVNQFCFGSLPVNLPKLITAHSDVLSWAAACRPDGLEQSLWLDRYIELVSSGLRGADALAAPTRWMLQALREHYTEVSTGLVIFNGRSVPPATKCESRELQAVSVGRLWDAAKNVSILDTINVQLPVFAVGEQRYENSALRQQDGNVSFIDSLAEKDLLGLFRRSCIYLATSIYEPFGLAPLEAALCGCAIVANDIPSLREVWGEGALYFQNGGELSGILNLLRRSPSHLRSARQRSWQRALNFGSDVMTAAYIALYETLVSSSSQHAPPEQTTIAC